MKRILSLILLLATIQPVLLAQGFPDLNTDDGDNKRITMNRDTTHAHKEIPKGLHTWTVDERFGDREESTPDTVVHMFMNTIFTTGLRGEYNTTGNLGAPRINRIFIDRPESDQFIFTQPYDYFNVPAGQVNFTNTLSPFTNVYYTTCGNRTNGEDHFKARFAVNAGKRIGIGFKSDYIYGRGYYADQSTSHFNFTLYGSYLGDRYNAHIIASTNSEKVAENGGIINDANITSPEQFAQSYRTNEILTMLTRTWNRNNNLHLFLTHRYNIGFSREVPMTEEEIKAKRFALASEKAKQEKEAREKAIKEGRDPDKKEEHFAGRPDDATIVEEEPEAEPAAQDSDQRIQVSGMQQADSLLAMEQKAQEDTAWVKKEFVPVTSFIHTAKLDQYQRIYQAYETPDEYYANEPFLSHKDMTNDSIYDRTRHWRLKNTVALALLEGFNKWAKAGLKVFATHDLRHFELPVADSISPYSKYNEHTLSIGGQLIKAQGKTIHYNLLAETWLIGKDAGQMKIDGRADLNIPLLGDTVQLAAHAFIHRTHPAFYFRHYHSKFFWWDNDDLKKQFRTHIEGRFSYPKTHTNLRVAADALKNYTYFGTTFDVIEAESEYAMTRLHHNVGVRQCDKNISLLTIALQQDFRLGPLNWENMVTFQKSSDEDVLPLPKFNIYTNLYLKFRIAGVLSVDLGADARYFTKYNAPDYVPAIGQYAVQENPEGRVELGNYPIVNVYANMHLKSARFFVMMSHINAGSGSMNYFLTPHYPLNERILRLGVSWNFFN